MSAFPNLSASARDHFSAWFELYDAASQAPIELSVAIEIAGVAKDAQITHYRLSSSLSNTYDYCVRQEQDCSDPVAVNDGAGAMTQVQGASLVVEAGVGRYFLALERHQVDLLVIDPL